MRKKRNEAYCHLCDHRFAVRDGVNTAVCPNCSATVQIEGNRKRVEVSGHNVDEVEQVATALTDSGEAPRRSIRDRVENNATVWLLGTLLTGFLAGIATYEGILRIAALDPLGP